MVERSMTIKVIRHDTSEEIFEDAAYFSASKKGCLTIWNNNSASCDGMRGVFDAGEWWKIELLP